MQLQNDIMASAHKTLGEICIPTVTHINNRKLMQGFYGGLGTADTMAYYSHRQQDG